jgi:hypothetical protein
LANLLTITLGAGGPYLDSDHDILGQFFTVKAPFREERQLVKIRSSVILMIIYKYAKHYNYLQANLQKLQTYTNTFKIAKVNKMLSLLRLEWSS